MDLERQWVTLLNIINRNGNADWEGGGGADVLSVLNTDCTPDDNGSAQLLGSASAPLGHHLPIRATQWIRIPFPEAKNHGKELTSFIKSSSKIGKSPIPIQRTYLHSKVAKTTDTKR